MPLFTKLVRRPIGAVACTAAAMVLVQLHAGTAQAAPMSGTGLRAEVGGTSYLDAVAEDNPTHLWRLDDSEAEIAEDSVETEDLAVDASATRGAAGPMESESTPATAFSGDGVVPATTASAVTGPQSFSVEAWFKTTSTSGGKIIGFGGSRTGNSTNYDRHLYLTNAGNVTFGVYPGGYRTLTSSKTYNDGQWHHVVGSLGSSGMNLFVDARRVGYDTSDAGAQNFSGYWRVGGDNLSAWPNQPTDSSLAGTLADVAVYPAPLSLTQVQTHYAASGRTAAAAAAPTDAYGAAVYGDAPSFYWRLDESSGTTVRDEMSGDTQSGSYSAGTVINQPGSPASRPSGHSIRLPGDSAQTVSSNVQVANPTVYSLETWFKTTTTSGGRLIGFGSSRTGTSTNRDRHIYMINSGQLRYGIYVGTEPITVDSPQSYNDGQWHHVVATQGANGEQLFVDGQLVAAGAAVRPQNYTGYWRLGTDRTWEGASTDSLAGSLDEAAVYPTVLSAAAVQQHYQLGAPPPPNANPTAAFSSSVAKLKVSFNAAASADSDGSIASYAWDFGDGTSGTGVSPQHTYPATGTYTAVLTVTDDKGATALISHDVAVTANAAPAAAFSSECTDLDCTFDAAAAADSDGTIASYAWNLGDGATATGTTPAHSYTAAGTYDVSLTVTDNDGATNEITQSVTVTARNNPPTAALTADCTDLDCTFDGRGSTDPDGAIASYAWDFGDELAGSASHGTHSYDEPGSYTATLTVTDDKGATGSASIVVTATAPNQPPVAAFEDDCTDLDCVFNAAGASDPDGSVVAYAWTFGDGGTSTQVSPSHTYEAGTYTVTLVVTDDDGATGTVTREVTAVEPNRAPVAEFTSTVTNLSVAFDAAGSTDEDGEIASYLWEFGDGVTSTQVAPSHTYAVAGTYQVTLTVTDDDGASDTTSAEVTATNRIIASDTFSRTVASGLGTAETGGNWTVSGTGTTSSVADGSGRIAVLPARTTSVRLPSATALDTDLVHSIWLEQQPSGSGATLYTTVRDTATGDYRVRLKVAPVGTMSSQLVKVVGTTETPLTSVVAVPGNNLAVNAKVRIRIQAFGSAPTTIRAKIWLATVAEPVNWLASVTDSTAGLQSPGSIGHVNNLLGNFSSSIIRLDDLVATERTDLEVTGP